jgi:hypothetical protein
MQDCELGHPPCNNIAQTTTLSNHPATGATDGHEVFERNLQTNGPRNSSDTTEQILGH